MNSALTADQRELLDMLRCELQEHLEESLNPHSTENEERLCRQAALVENLGNAAGLIGLQGLHEVCTRLHDNMLLLMASSNPEDVSLLIDTWPMYLLDYVQQLASGELSPEGITGLLEFLAHSTWPQPLVEPDQSALCDSLLHFQIETPDYLSAPELPRQVQADMLSLDLSETINPDLFEGLMLELPTQVSTFAEQIEAWISSSDPNALAHAQRIAHTIKGSANVVGISGLANFTHYCEDLLELLARNPQPLTGKLGQLLIDTTDTLSSLLDHLLAGSPAGELELTTTQQLLDTYHRLRAGEPLDEEQPPSADSTLSYTPNAQRDEDAPYGVKEQAPAFTGSPPQEATTAPQDRQGSQIRVREETAQELLRLAGEAAIGTNRIFTQAQQVKLQLHHIGLLHHKLTTLSEEFGQLIEVRNLFNLRGKSDTSGELDPLELDHYNELHSFFHQLQEFATDTRDAIYQTQSQVHNLEELTIEQQHTNRETQGHLLAMRMVPAKSLDARFQRCVRQACRLTGKQVTLTVTGGDTPIDSRVMNDLIDPLMHLLRNAVDHGIEAPEQRQALGKSTEGNIELRFATQGQSILVHVRDDGAGLNSERIASRASELGITASSDALISDDAWLQQLIFSAGFSTRTEISQTSGRGIGLDVVSEGIARLNGRIAVQSEPGAGCEFILRLPMTVIAEHQLLVASGSHQLAVAARGVEQLLFLEPDELTEKDAQLTYRYDNQDLNVYHLAEIAQLPESSGATAINHTEARAMLIVEHPAGQRCGVLLERVIASREMVIKPLSACTPVVPGVIGATILGDGRVAPVVDVQQLVADYSRTATNADHWRKAHARMQEQLSRTQRPLALVVDDSLSTRRSLAQFVSDIGLDVRTAKDGYEAIDILRDTAPTVMLVDMEMPRMNGLELTAHVRAQENTRHIPVIMITSRNTEKHRRLASAAGVNTYLNKPFSEEELTRHIEASMQPCTPQTITL